MKKLVNGSILKFEQLVRGIVVVLFVFLRLGVRKSDEPFAQSLDVNPPIVNGNLFFVSHNIFVDGRRVSRPCVRRAVAGTKLGG